MDLIKHDIPSLLGKLAGEVSNLARDEIAVAKIELKESAKEAAKDSAAMAGGASLVYAGVLFLLMAGMFGLAAVMPMWASALTVGALSIVAGGVAMRVGANRLSTEVPGLEHTKATMRTNIEHTKAAMREHTRATLGSNGYHAKERLTV